MGLLRLFITNILLALSSFCYSQQIDSTKKNVEDIPDKYYSKVDSKLSIINNKLTKKSVKYLTKFQRHEKRLQEKLGNLNADATNVFANANEKYNQFSSQIKSKITKATGERAAYSGYADTLSTSLSFLKQFKNTGSAVIKPIESLNILQNKLQQSEKIKEFVAQRKQQIKDLLSKYTKIPASLKKEYTRLNKTAYYYSAQLNYYREALKNPSKIEQKALNLLNKLPAFQKFMKQNSQLALLFPIPGNYGTPQALAGLQTRASVQTLIQQQVSAGGPNALQVIQRNIALAHSELDKLKDKINKFGGGSSDVEVPDFKPNTQKTKSFLRRLEFGCDIQFAKSSNLFPSTTNIGLNLGYKLNDKSSLGIGLSYRMGMGTIRHIVISNEGIGLRSFADYQIKKSFYLSGGYEMNYNTRFKNIEQLKRFNAWQSSGLIGVSKKYGVSKKVKGEMKLLYDFLANDHRPVTQPLVFRLGYSLK